MKSMTNKGTNIIKRDHTAEKHQNKKKVAIHRL